MKIHIYIGMLLIIMAGAFAVVDYEARYDNVFQTLDSYGCFGVGDLNGDGIEDLILSDQQETSMYLGTSLRQYQKVLNPFGTTFRHCNIIIADYDTDFDLDIIIMGLQGSISLIPTTRLYLNDGNGVFTLFQTLDGSDSLRFTTFNRISYDDIDGNGYLDIMALGYNISTLVDLNVYYGFPEGLYHDRDANGDLSATDNGFDFGDWDYDGDKDLVYGNKIYENIGNVFHYVEDLSAPSGQMVIVYDFDGIGMDDIFVSSTYGTYTYKADYNFSFTEKSTSAYGLSGWNYDVGDADNNGKVDVIISGLDNDYVGWERLRSNRLAINSTFGIGFGYDVSLVGGLQAGKLMLFDADNDGDLDIYNMVNELQYSQEKRNKFYLNTQIDVEALPENEPIAITGSLIDVENGTGLLPEMVNGIFGFFEGIGTRGYYFIFAMIFLVLIIAIISFIPAIVKKVATMW